MMTKESLLNEVTKIFWDVFGDESLKIEASTCSDDIDDWDSLAQVNLVVAIEKFFKVKLDLNEIMVLKNVGDMIDLLERKLSAQP